MKYMVIRFTDDKDISNTLPEQKVVVRPEGQPEIEGVVSLTTVLGPNPEPATVPFHTHSIVGNTGEPK
ncbi:MAG: hypothetical protein PHQ43_13350 [Dehalococcoidales bacterium]|nr:hypothetical protein [Dehalococcoidales bacterium]